MEKLSFNREVLFKLRTWKDSKNRQPLIINGVRQVGKTSLIKAFGKSEFRDLLYVNFESSKEVEKIFQRNLNPEKILEALSIEFNKSIDPHKDLIFFDEIQECPNALTSLKYFEEELPHVAVIGAGSLLGVKLNESSYPVGKVKQIDLYPLNFFEFLDAINEKILLEQLRIVHLKNNSEKVGSLSETLHQKLWDTWKLFLVIGGMPACVAAYVNCKESLFEKIKVVRETQDLLIQQYLNDFAKHSGKVNALHLERIFKNIPSQLAKVQDDSVKRFRFSGVVPGISSYSRLVSAFDWLEGAGLIYKIPIIDSALTPLTQHVQENLFKTYIFDVGILNALSELPAKDILKYDFGTYKGYIAENYVLQQLKASNLKNIYGWNENTSEVEFIYQDLEEVVPIEVKAGRVTQAKSLGNFIKKYTPSKAFIFGATIPKINPPVKRLPIYGAGVWELK